jgi:hypothetical protein
MTPLKKLIIAEISLLVFASSWCFSEDSAGSFSLSIHNKTMGYFDTPAEMLITDPQGRRLGYDSSAPFNSSEQMNMFMEIPGARYTQGGIGASSDEDPLGVDDSGLSNYREFYVQQAIRGKYLLQVIGIRNGAYLLEGTFDKSDGTWQFLKESPSFITQGETTTLNIDYDPTPGTPAPVIIKTITFHAVRGDVSVALQLNQLGDEKFARSLIKTIDLAEKLSITCAKRKHNKDKVCEPSVAVLKLFVKRLEKANQKCDSRKPKACDEDEDWDAFDREHRKDHDYDDFFRDWDRDDWHKWQKNCKRFVTDEALNIIKEDTQWLIKSLGGKTEKERDDHHGNEGKGR